MLPLSYRPILYPSYRYHAVEAPRRVASAAEADALGPEWGDLPGGGHSQSLPSLAAAETAPAAPAADTSAAGDADPVVEAAQAAELHSTNADTVIAKLRDAQNLASLQRTRQFEEAHPHHKGGRKRVLAAIDARLAAMGAPTL